MLLPRHLLVLLTIFLSTEATEKGEKLLLRTKRQHCTCLNIRYGNGEVVPAGPGLDPLSSTYRCTCNSAGNPVQQQRELQMILQQVEPQSRCACGPAGAQAMPPMCEPNCLFDQVPNQMQWECQCQSGVQQNLPPPQFFPSNQPGINHAPLTNSNSQMMSSAQMALPQMQQQPQTAQMGLNAPMAPQQMNYQNQIHTQVNQPLPQTFNNPMRDQLPMVNPGCQESSNGPCTQINSPVMQDGVLNYNNMNRIPQQINLRIPFNQSPTPETPKDSNNNNNFAPTQIPVQVNRQPGACNPANGPCNQPNVQQNPCEGQDGACNHRFITPPQPALHLGPAEDSPCSQPPCANPAGHVANRAGLQRDVVPGVGVERSGNGPNYAPSRGPNSVGDGANPHRCPCMEVVVNVIRTDAQGNRYPVKTPLCLCDSSLDSLLPSRDQMTPLPRQEMPSLPAPVPAPVPCTVEPCPAPQPAAPVAPLMAQPVVPLVQHQTQMLPVVGAQPGQLLMYPDGYTATVAGQPLAAIPLVPTASVAPAPNVYQDEEPPVVPCLMISIGGMQGRYCTCSENYKQCSPTQCCNHKTYRSLKNDLTSSTTTPAPTMDPPSAPSSADAYVSQSNADPYSSQGRVHPQPGYGSGHVQAAQPAPTTTTAASPANGPNATSPSAVDLFLEFVDKFRQHLDG